jgi:hypothetical protein
MGASDRVRGWNGREQLLRYPRGRAYGRLTRRITRQTLLAEALRMQKMDSVTSWAACRGRSSVGRETVAGPCCTRLALLGHPLLDFRHFWIDSHSSGDMPGRASVVLANNQLYLARGPKDVPSGQRPWVAPGNKCSIPDVSLDRHTELVGASPLTDFHPAKLANERAKKPGWARARRTMVAPPGSPAGLLPSPEATKVHPSKPADRAKRSATEAVAVRPTIATVGKVDIVRDVWMGIEEYWAAGLKFDSLAQALEYCEMAKTAQADSKLRGIERLTSSALGSAPGGTSVDFHFHNSVGHRSSLSASVYRSAVDDDSFQLEAPPPRVSAQSFPPPPPPPRPTRPQHSNTEDSVVVEPESSTRHASAILKEMDEILDRHVPRSRDVLPSGITTSVASAGNPNRKRWQRPEQAKYVFMPDTVLLERQRHPHKPQYSLMSNNVISAQRELREKESEAALLRREIAELELLVLRSASGVQWKWGKRLEDAAPEERKETLEQLLRGSRVISRLHRLQERGKVESTSQELREALTGSLWQEALQSQPESSWDEPVDASKVHELSMKAKNLSPPSRAGSQSAIGRDDDFDIRTAKWDHVFGPGTTASDVRKTQEHLQAEQQKQSSRVSGAVKRSLTVASSPALEAPPECPSSPLRAGSPSKDASQASPTRSARSVGSPVSRDQEVSAPVGVRLQRRPSALERLRATDTHSDSEAKHDAISGLRRPSFLPPNSPMRGRGALPSISEADSE